VSGNALAFGAMPVSAGIELALSVAAIVALIYVIAIIDCTAPLNGLHHRMLLLCHPVFSAILLSVHPEDICDFTGRMVNSVRDLVHQTNVRIMQPIVILTYPAEGLLEQMIV